MMKTIEDAAALIARANQDAAQYVGYCGTDQDEIANTIREESMDDHMYWIGDDLLMLDYEEGSAEMWGPFVQSDTDWSERANELLKKVPENTVLYGFYGSKNRRAIAWMESLGADKKGEETILKADRFLTEESALHIDVQPFKAHQYDAFKKLHNNSFPDTYYNAETVIARSNEDRPVLVASIGNELIGYIYAESDPVFKEASVEYLAVDEEARGKGTGYALLREVMKKLFTEGQTETLTLCVSKSNQTAIRLYQRAGFQIDKELVYFKKQG
ncbi:GNAT family N-acetyltransferase [Jeotgalibacillus terrae]|uniref:GNAT family N-acetyltransferase n=1 Tax=Jeotgalibacillus terrae TaxID=587735 RepID=A0ABW5ZHR3_9BACL|nr:GNAT family N-acetyltransferase [Jeotgalibacillus terrae]MBM7579272.1 ribosomal protein S18 acetylase RimI-like enzyme [Jeotgalibacillus terrae]